MSKLTDLTKKRIDKMTLQKMRDLSRNARPSGFFGGESGEYFYQRLTELEAKAKAEDTT